MEQNEHFTRAFYETPISGFPVKAGEMDGGRAFLYHWHDSVEMLCGLEGATSVGVAGQPYALGEDDILIIGPGESHCVFPSGHQARRLCILFEPGQLFPHTLFPGAKSCFGQIARHSGQWPAEAKERIKDCISQIYEEYSARRPGWELLVQARLMETAAVAVRCLPKVERGAKRGEDGLLRKVLVYLSAEYLHEITLDSCANALGFHPAYLSHQFKAQTGISFHRYLVNLRLIKAESLLEDCALPIAHIPAASGFLSPKTFYRAFRQKHGVSPGEYRKHLEWERGGDT
ncbi:MAG: AraC family transcriptional regulator [Acutalibacter muris]|jgi:AraC-like DNA-binding protein|nr:AraC family transcriptional regulator [Acutalibacter muris]